MVYQDYSLDNLQLAWEEDTFYSQYQKFEIYIEESN